jgi:hypothetical protein
VYNVVSMTGGGVALFALAAIVILFFLESFAEANNPYLGIFTFIVFPSILAVGLILIAGGAIWEGRRRARGRTPIVIDFGKASHRNALVVFLSGTCVFLLITTIGLYEGFHYTESTEFCGQVCHTVMEPEHIAHQSSPHARVSCVSCHIGPGAGWYVKSKWSGARQVIKAVMDTYPRPIPTPIHNLRPAQDVCEQCHWPAKFFSELRLSKDYFLSDRENTHWQVKMLMKIGAGATLDPSRRVLDRVAWNRGGEEVIYTRGGKPFADSLLVRAREHGGERTMDCMDCHNRPSHQYRAPMEAINAAMASGKLDPGLPWIKREAVRVLSQRYGTREGGRDSIATALETFYRDEGGIPEEDVNAVLEVFDRNIFPEMNVRWETYPDHLSHFVFDGCFRCHGSDLETADGRTISADCNLCHTIDAQGPIDALEHASSEVGLTFRHPIDVDGAETEMACFECHSGDDSLY